MPLEDQDTTRYSVGAIGEMFKGEPLLIIAAVLSSVAALITLIQSGGWADGLSAAEVGLIAAPIITAGSARQQVYSPASIEQERRIQRKYERDLEESLRKERNISGRGPGAK